MIGGLTMGARPSSPYLALRPLERGVIAGALVVIVAMVGSISVWSEEGSHPLLFGSFIIYVLTLSLPLSRVFLGTPALFHPLFFYATWIGLRSLLTGEAVLGATGLEFHRALGGMSGTELQFIAARSFLLEALALICLYAGYGMLRNIRVRTLRPTGTPRRFYTAAALWMILPAIGVLMLVMEAGGLGSLLMQRGLPSDQRISAEIGGHWSFLAGTGSIVPVVWLAFDRTAARRPLFWAFALYAAIMVFAATGSRSDAIMPFITIALMWALRNRDIPYKSLWMAAVVAVVAVGMLGEFRAATRGIDRLADVQYQAEIWSGAKSGYEELIRRSTTNNGQIAILGSVPEQIDHLYGKSYLSIPFVIIPSAIWPWETPDAAGKLNAKLVYGTPLGGIPAGNVGEAYWNFSYPGVVLIYLAFGGLLRLLASIYKANSNHALVATVYLYTLTSLSPGSNAIYNFAHSLAPVVAFFVFLILTERLRVGPSEAPQKPSLYKYRP